MTTPEARYARLKTTAVSVWAAIGILILLAVAFWGLGKIASALTPFVVAFVIAFLLNWPVRALASRGMKRGTAALICLLSGLLLFGAVVTLLAPSVSRQAVELANSAPAVIPQIEDAVAQVQGRFTRLVFPVWAGEALKSASSQLSQIGIRMGNSAATGIVNVGGGVVKGFFDLFIALVIAFWALKDLPKIREEILVISGPKYHDDAQLLINTVARTVGGYLKGQTIASLTTAALVFVGLSVLGEPYALVLGDRSRSSSTTCRTSDRSRPGCSPPLSGLFGPQPWTWIAAIVVVVVAQNFTDTVVTPRVMSEQVDLHPILVILSLLVGASLFGIAGMLFAIPVAATGKGLFVYYYELRTDRQLASEDGALFRAAGCDSPDDDCIDPESPDGMAV